MAVGIQGWIIYIYIYIYISLRACVRAHAHLSVVWDCSCVRVQHDLRCACRRVCLPYLHSEWPPVTSDQSANDQLLCTSATGP
jgi:hypothetical protein